MVQEFVNYEIALELSKLGFDIECFCSFDRSKVLRGKIIHSTNEDYLQKDKYDSHLPAPLFQQVFRWFQEKHELYGFIDKTRNEGEFQFSIYKRLKNDAVFEYKWNVLSYSKQFKTYEETQLECIKNLIKELQE